MGLSILSINLTLLLLLSPLFGNVIYLISGRITTWSTPIQVDHMFSIIKFCLNLIPTYQFVKVFNVLAEETTGTYDFVEDVVEEGDYYGFMKAFEEPRIRYIFEIGIQINPLWRSYAWFVFDIFLVLLSCSLLEYRLILSRSVQTNTTETSTILFSKVSVVYKINKGCCRWENVKAVEGLDLKLTGNLKIALLGENGAGKSTTIGICTKEINATSGSVSFKKDCKIGYCSQFDSFFDYLTGFEFCKIYGGIRGASVEEVIEVLQNLGLKDLDSSHRDISSEIISGYSGGERRRLSVACAIIGNPDVLILDEPTAGVDVKSRGLIWSVVTKFEGAVVTCTHDVEELLGVVEEVVVLKEGKTVVEQGNNIICVCRGEDKRDETILAITSPLPKDQARHSSTILNLYLALGEFPENVKELSSTKTIFTFKNSGIGDSIMKYICESDGGMSWEYKTRTLQNKLMEINEEQTSNDNSFESEEEEDDDETVVESASLMNLESGSDSVGVGDGAVFQPTLTSAVLALLKKDLINLLSSKVTLLIMFLAPALVLFPVSSISQAAGDKADAFINTDDLEEMFINEFNNHFPVTVNDDKSISITLTAVPDVIFEPASDFSLEDFIFAVLNPEANHQWGGKEYEPTGYTCLTHFYTSTGTDVDDELLPIIDNIFSHVPSKPCKLAICREEPRGMTEEARLKWISESVLEESEGCRNTCFEGSGQNYRGKVAQSTAGLECQKWSEQWPNGHTRTPEHFPGMGLGDHNYCRNPDYERLPWCYVMSERRWDYCDPFHMCDEFNNDSVGDVEVQVPFFSRKESKYAMEEKIFDSMKKLNRVPRTHLEHEPFPAYLLPDGYIHVHRFEEEEDGSLILGFSVSIGTDKDYMRPSNFNRLNYIKYDSSSVGLVTSNFKAQLKAINLFHAGLLEVPGGGGRVDNSTTDEEVLILSFLDTRIAQQYLSDVRIVPTFGEGESTSSEELKGVLEGAVALAFPLLMSLNIPILINQAVEEKSGIRFVMLAAGVHPASFGLSIFCSSFLFSLGGGIVTHFAALYLDIGFWVDEQALVLTTLFVWSIACSGIVVLASTLYEKRESANTGGYLVSILGSLLSSLLTSVMFGIAAEQILGEDAVRAAAPNPTVKFPPGLLFLWPHLPLSRIFYCAHVKKMLGVEGKLDEVAVCIVALIFSGLLFTGVGVGIDVWRHRGDGKKVEVGVGGIVRRVSTWLRSPSRTSSRSYDGLELISASQSQSQDRGDGVVMGSDADAPILSLFNVSKSYQKEGTFSLEGVTFDVKAQECVGLLGKNGAGKSTIQKIVAGTITHSSGSVKRSSENRIGYCMQGNTVWNNLTVLQHLQVYANALGLSNADAVIEEVLKLSGLWVVKGRKAKALSGGMLRRLCASVALMVGRSGGLVMLDEPSSGLDLKNSRKLWRGIKRLMEENNCGVLLTTHLGEEAEVLCDQVVVLKRGRVVGGLGGKNPRDKRKLKVDVFARQEEVAAVLRALGEFKCECEGGSIKFEVGYEEMGLVMKLLGEIEVEILWRICGGDVSIDERIGA
ncbi:hypothetical protein TL16_g11928 [Triparma laevis f. inornata]|uniref:Uncharacterized protein n=1 Tax=Triparma laevis f. inornata TaxID=1714386 RepID=A0A9W7EUD4_9STRA|nr:hypothetical protein TL16_g11928 [Triparma laevis f. inornata]